MNFLKNLLSKLTNLFKKEEKEEKKVSEVVDHNDILMGWSEWYPHEEI